MALPRGALERSARCSDGQGVRAPALFVGAPGIVVTRDQLLRDVWGESYRGGPRTVDIHVRRLRIKLGAQWIETIRRVGYKFRRRG